MTAPSTPPLCVTSQGSGSPLHSHCSPAAPCASATRSSVNTRRGSGHGRRAADCFPRTVTTDHRGTSRRHTRNWPPPTPSRRVREGEATKISEAQGTWKRIQVPPANSPCRLNSRRTRGTTQPPTPSGALPPQLDQLHYTTRRHINNGRTRATTHRQTPSGAHPLHQDPPRQRGPAP